MPAAATLPEATDQYRVRDRNAVGGPRTHEPVPGKTYSLSAEGEGTLMPAEHALVFTRDKAFEVFNEKGQLVPSMPSGAIANTISEAGGIKLAPGDTVAKFAELTQEALYARAASVPGGERLRKNTGRAKLITFLMEHHGDPGRPDAIGRDPALDDMDDSTTASMIDAEGGL